MSKNPMLGLRLIWVQSFLAVIEHNSFSAAAKTLGCNQSTVSRNVEHLEIWLGGNLFDFTSPLQVSDYGMRFKDVAVKMIDMLESCRTSQRLDRKSVVKPRSKKRNIAKIDAATLKA
ncbi:LysR family transcriptional regulator [Sphingorhabdus sp.]|uniref:LysR family transcriptional regulator n=1 Tax=Sphingorhabdus sp. TaxID=1902408 RepID=UPI00398357F2